MVWLSGVRRAGKTFLSQSLEDIEYFDCELPRVRRMIDDPEAFLKDNRGCRIVLDEIHRLERPSEILKIAADHFPNTKILATGSSTLGASAKFRDTLAGRKEELWLTPMTTADLEDFSGADLHHRLLHGGLPAFFLGKQLPEKDFQEWMDAYWAKDIQELFRLERRQSFQKFAELLMAQSGGIFEAVKVAALAQAFNLPIANGGGWPHHNMHLQAAMANGWRVEFHFEMWGVGDKIYKEPPAPVNGWVTLPDTPGLGLEPRFDRLEEFEEK